MLSVAIRADGSVFDASLNSVPVDTRVEFLCNICVARPARGRDPLTVHACAGIGSLGHFVTSMAIHAVCRFAVSPQQGLAMNAVLIGRDEAGGRRRPRSDIRVIKMAGKTHTLLRNLQFLFVPVGFGGDVITMAGQTSRTSGDSLPRSLAMC